VHCDEPSRACEHLRQPGAALAGDMPGCDGIDELITREQLKAVENALGAVGTTPTTSLDEECGRRRPA
jgi:hypothetical protein